VRSAYVIVIGYGAPASTLNSQRSGSGLGEVSYATAEAAAGWEEAALQTPSKEQSTPVSECVKDARG
jgi:hypothetical protein